jgi:hypothetical protein
VPIGMASYRELKTGWGCNKITLHMVGEE